MSKAHELDKLVPTSTDMGVGLICNTDKIYPSEERWKYGDFDNESDKEKDDDKRRNDNHSDGELDADLNSYMSDKKSVFKKEQRKHHGHSNSNSTRGTAEKERGEGTETTRSDSERGDLMKDKEMLFKKMDMMRKLGELKQCGVNLSRNYSIESDLELMECEYKLHHDIRAKQNSVQWMSHMLIGIVKGTEMFNDNYNPFDIKLTGLSNRISSDMHNYYSVLGDIYEKYNHPGKEMGPEMRLLLMLSGAALSMQVNTLMTGGISGNNAAPSNEVRDEMMLKELRRKAEQDSNALDEKTREYMKKQHDVAAQKVADLKMIKDKELESQKINKLLNTRNFRDNLLLSESPTPRQMDTQHSIDHNNEKNENNGNEKIQELRLTQEEIEHIQKIKNMEEQQHLEMMRRLAHQKSESFRNSLHQINRDDRRKRELNLQNQQLDKIISGLDLDHDRNVAEQKKNKIKNKSKSSDNYSDNQSSNQSNQSDNQSNESTISVNPRLKNIMNKSKTNTKKIFTHDPMVDIKMDENIKLLLDQNDSDYDKLSKDDISVGSSRDKKDKNKKKIDFTQMSFGSKTKGTKPTLKTGK